LALKKVYFGSVGPFVYDDTVSINDPDGDFAGEDHHAITTDGGMIINDSEYTGSGSDMDDAISKAHVQGTDTSVGALTIYANNAAAVAGGLAVNDLYRNGADPDLVCVVH
jgi:hypothetical protein